MKVLILEDEPIIAWDLEDIVQNHLSAEVILLSSLEDALAHARQADGDVDFALLDVELDNDGETSIPLAKRLMERGVPFCFVSGSTGRIPSEFRSVPRITKPFQPHQIESVLPLAA
ncbi:response regulator [Jiella marina]|uniref:response regulator n=1 Tax=Jiella sp. LLJ827 TaxID=2917712 RepID=UPI0021017C8A|nr:response regulator [Jiella sp. LLJ827]MCQ0988938.1 response regulator [Jiella sp. LLJ827]